MPVSNSRPNSKTVIIQYMSTPVNNNSYSKWVLTPVFGSILFVTLYITATFLYPGGSQQYPHAKGFSWLYNYWCNLLNYEAINGAHNTARPVAIAAMMVLCISLASFWYYFPYCTNLSAWFCKAIRISGVAGMTIVLLLFANLYHDAVINIAGIAALVALLGTAIGIYRNKWYGLFWFGMICALLIGVNNYIYYTGNGLLYLPVIQKITFLCFLLWICLINIKMYSKINGRFPFGKNPSASTGLRKISSILLLCCLYLVSCKEVPADRPSKKYIALQPINQYNSRQLDFIKKEIQQFFHRQVIVLPATTVPQHFVNTEKGKRYNADSIVYMLRSLKNDSLIDVVGITHEDIYTTKRDIQGNIKQPVATYKVWGIFGLGYQPGPSCIISDHRLYTDNNPIFQRRLRTVVIHEIGHNLGLPHCSSTGCIMSDANEKMATVDNSSNDYCKKCKRKIENHNR